MKFHSTFTGSLKRWIVLIDGIGSDQTYTGDIIIGTDIGQSRNMIRKGPSETDYARMIGVFKSFYVILEFAPLVSTKQGMDQILPFNIYPGAVIKKFKCTNWAGYVEWDFQERSIDGILNMYKE